MSVALPEIFSGGFVTYAKEQKEKLLQIDPDLLAEHGVVSEACAKAMAQNAEQL